MEPVIHYADPTKPTKALCSFRSLKETTSKHQEVTCSSCLAELERALPTWKTIRDFPNYEVNAEGVVRNRESGKHVNGVAITSGTIIVQLRKHTQTTTRTVARLVWSAFNQEDSEAYIVKHKNNDPSDNRLCNLYRKERSLKKLAKRVRVLPASITTSTPMLVSSRGISVAINPTVHFNSTVAKSTGYACGVARTGSSTRSFRDVTCELCRVVLAQNSPFFRFYAFSENSYF